MRRFSFRLLLLTCTYELPSSNSSSKLFKDLSSLRIPLVPKADQTAEELLPSSSLLHCLDLFLLCSYHSISRMSSQMILLFCLILIAGRSINGDSTETDREVLIQLKSFLRSSNIVNQGQYVEWGQPDLPLCSWPRISCSKGRVASIDLSNSNISGTFFGNFSALTLLSSLDLSMNAISGNIPADLNQCKILRYLNLSRNILQGELNLTGLNQLETVDLNFNRLGGAIQANFPAICGRLISLKLSSNNFSGKFSDSFDSCGTLEYLDLSSNGFVGSISAGFARLREFSASNNKLTGEISPSMFATSCNLEVLDLSENQFTGEFPHEISNCKALVSLNIYGNGFSGLIPSAIGALQDLQALHLGGNNFSREIPEMLLNCSKLTFLDVSKTNFGGEIQPIFERFVQLKFLVLHRNRYSGGIRSSHILRLPQLEQLDLSYNNFSGELPTGISNTSNLKSLILACNQFHGEIPPEYGNLSLLQALDLSFNRLTGRIPPNIGNLKSLLWLTLANNALTGEIPREIGNCSSLLWLNLADNRLSGEIPSTISDTGKNAEQTVKSNWQYDTIVAGSGYFPATSPLFGIFDRNREIYFWDRLLEGQGIIITCQNTHNSSDVIRTLSMGYLQLSGNNLTGEIPPEIGSMRNLNLLNLGRNALSGRLPPELKNLPLLFLNVSWNIFSGQIPEELGDLRCLQNLDLSHNNFSGELPVASLSELHWLSELNISYNPLLSGRIPRFGQLATFGSNSYLGNPHLRGVSSDTDDPNRWQNPTESGDESEEVMTNETTQAFATTFFPSFVVFASVSFYLSRDLWKKHFPAKLR
ncbi:probable LRR receptor-like serine/threonine-protein kinase At1g74360 [Aristolochia californica]|uniref:probable LRR receptor-like serine/threonine-protein kinase At1g74360 n=1 Tax=Aristolochia californica TaxID=171875 RepID=UPI0035DB5554